MISSDSTASVSRLHHDLGIHQLKLDLILRNLYFSVQRSAVDIGASEGAL